MKKYFHDQIRRVLCIALCLATVCVPLTGFGTALDSLEKVLSTEALKDKEKLDILKVLSRSYVTIDVQRALDFGNKGLRLAQKSRDGEMEFTFYKNMSLAHYVRGAYDTAISYLKKAGPIADELQDYKLQGTVYNTYGNIYFSQGMYDLALENYFAAAKIYDAHEDAENLVVPYNNIGGAYQLMKNYEQALKYFQMTEKLALQTGDEEGLAGVYVSMSDITLNQGKPKDVSLNYARKAVAIFKKLENKFAENNALLCVAKIHSEHRDYAEAEAIARQALAQAKEIGAPNLTAMALMILSNAHLNQADYTAAIELAKTALATDSTNKNVTKNAYSNLALAHAFLGQPELTHSYMEKYRESLTRYANEAYQNSISAMEVQYETKKKALKIESLEQQKQFYIWLGIAGALLLLAALAVAIIRYRLAVSRRKLAEEATRRLEQEQQLIAVQATLDGEAAERTRLAKDLHDGLGSMLSLVKFNLPQVEGDAVLEAVDASRFRKALGMLDDSIQELRRVAHHMMPESLLRFGLKVSLSDFCDAIPIARFHYFGDEARLPGKLEMMIYHCIHELVNNALKHAGARQINVQLVQDEDRVSFTVQDDGKGFDQQSVKEGMGLQNIRQRVAAFEGKIELSSSNKGTEIHVELEWNKNDAPH